MPNPDDYPKAPMPDWVREIFSPDKGEPLPFKRREEQIRELEKELEDA